MNELDNIQAEGAGTTCPVFKYGRGEFIATAALEVFATFFRRLRFGRNIARGRLYVDVGCDVIRDFLEYAGMRRVHFESVKHKRDWVVEKVLHNDLDGRDMVRLIGRHNTISFCSVNDINRLNHTIFTDYWSRNFGVILSGHNYEHRATQSFIQRVHLKIRLRRTNPDRYLFKTKTKPSGE